MPSLNTHFHYHLVVLDGVFSGADDGRAQFHAASQLTTAHWLDLQRVVQRRVLRYFHTQSLLDEADASGMLTWQGIVNLTEWERNLGSGSVRFTQAAVAALQSLKERSRSHR